MSKNGESHQQRPLSVGILGIGNIGMVHLQSALAMDGIEVSAVADAVPENRELAHRWGIHTSYDDYGELLESESIDAAVVALPPSLHRDAVEQAAANGCDVFVEKPLARSVSEADAMVDAAEAENVALGVDHTIRYMPDVKRVKDKYDSGRIGYVPYATISRVNNGPFDRVPVENAPPSWPLDPELAGGGVLLELGVHLFDVLEWFFGELEVEAADVGSQLSIPVEDAATVLLRSQETGTVVTMHCGSYQWEELPEINMSFRLDGVAGVLDNRDYLPKNFYTSAARSATENVFKRLRGEDPNHYGPTYYLQAHYEALADFFGAIRAGEKPPVDGEVGRRTIELAESAYETASTEQSLRSVRQ
ncbi:Gfo/Idh/MocA family oxidoreductase (plasmid) [Haloferax mediterranei ATCC 33500]|uniref:Gfo/Idh/MocA family oxidoreductase n=1 Tax=Haloferax mediterranei (strain ATCC 33500 / DSM 1411 / JCM 8866 / NBRC 14739 / NCIMB 2177 / R-4) TaxID=523841 RepID=I3RAS2_HALMT|nr:Gfo/Idh/MocA family oxidoreductase [Haloferax mediterranei]AFK21332.1 myo-inositol 2-dehydrogenase [Haloferax mediterranei ATCC 33500]ELZ97341.1 myo-inositol 2-dehydrogenase [Haloferax mediterranei ATCC 33500]MDX5990363.1 Gfo/Idh/MocA family oxidoreductase [Haloferax mediterranei ATCC 33500]QCQ76978.1 Gfo/Idh/MocA family oxidoreductase [Haloferax mediterranei ATCC 33500]